MPKRTCILTDPRRKKKPFLASFRKQTCILEWKKTFSHGRVTQRDYYNRRVSVENDGGAQFSNDLIKKIAYERSNTLFFPWCVSYTREKERERERERICVVCIHPYGYFVQFYTNPWGLRKDSKPYSQSLIHVYTYTYIRVGEWVGGKKEILGVYIWVLICVRVYGLLRWGCTPSCTLLYIIS